MGTATIPMPLADPEARPLKMSSDSCFSLAESYVVVSIGGRYAGLTPNANPNRGIPLHYRVELEDLAMMGQDLSWWAFDSL